MTDATPNPGETTPSESQTSPDAPPAQPSIPSTDAPEEQQHAGDDDPGVPTPSDA